jgi:hypothetical protein
MVVAGTLSGRLLVGLWCAPLSVLQHFVGIERVVLIEDPEVCSLQEISQWLATLLNAGDYTAEDRGVVQVIVEQR